DGPPIPLVIIPATVISASRPFLESPFVADQAGAEWISRDAEKLGVGVLWAGYRVRPYGNPIDLAHLDEVTGAAARDYHFDSARFTLWGTSSAGLVCS